MDPNIHNEIQKTLERINLESAIPGEVRHSLAEILPLIDKDSLTFIAEFYDLPIKPHMNMQKLADALPAKMCSMQQIAVLAVIMNERELAFLSRLLIAGPDGKYTKTILRDNFVRLDDSEFLMEVGLVFSFAQEGEISFLCTDETRYIYPFLIAPLVTGKRTQYQFIDRYLRAMTNLYRVFSLDHFVEVFTRQNPEFKLSKFGLESAVILLQKRGGDYLLMDDLIVTTNLIKDDEIYEGLYDFLDSVACEPYYVPEQDQLLKYEDDYYYDPSQELENLQSFILQELIPDKMLVEGLVDDIKIFCIEEWDVAHILSEFERRKIVLSSPKQSNDLIQLITDVKNTTRIATNRGFTPLELLRQGKPSSHSSSNSSSNATMTQGKITQLFPSS